MLDTSETISMKRRAMAPTERWHKALRGRGAANAGMPFAASFMSRTQQGQREKNLHSVQKSRSPETVRPRRRAAARGVIVAAKIPQQ